jgi:hypothetical protein
VAESQLVNQRLVEKSLDLTPQVVVALAGFGEKRRALAHRVRGRSLIEILDSSGPDPWLETGEF